MIKNIYVRLTVIVISTILLMTVVISGYWLTNGQGSIVGHIVWVSLFLIFLIFHVMLRKKRFIKMLKEAFEKESSLDKYDYHTLLESLSQRSLEELCQSLQIKKSLLQDSLVSLNIEVASFEEKLNCIAIKNNYQEQKLFVMMMELYLQNIKKENNGINANKFR